MALRGMLTSRRGELAVFLALAAPLAINADFVHLLAPTRLACALAVVGLVVAAAFRTPRRLTSAPDRRRRQRDRRVALAWCAVVAASWVPFIALDLGHARFGAVLIVVAVGAAGALLIALARRGHARRRTLALAFLGGVGVVAGSIVGTAARAHVYTVLPPGVPYSSMLMVGAACGVVVAAVAAALALARPVHTRALATVPLGAAAGVSMLVVWLAARAEGSGCSGVSDVYELTLTATVWLVYPLAPLIIGRVLVPRRTAPAASHTERGTGRLTSVAVD